MMTTMMMVMMPVRGGGGGWEECDDTFRSRSVSQLLTAGGGDWWNTQPARNEYTQYILQNMNAIFVLKWRKKTCNTLGQHNLCISLEEYTKCTYCNRRTQIVYFTGWRNTRRHLVPHHPVLPRGSQEICRIIVQSKALASQSALSSGKRHSLGFAIQFLRMQ